MRFQWRARSSNTTSAGRTKDTLAPIDMVAAEAQIATYEQAFSVRSKKYRDAETT